MFNFEEVEDFDKHINLSIPNYDGLLNVLSGLCLELVPKGGRILDIGCSTGAFLSNLKVDESVTKKACDVVKMSELQSGFEFYLSKASDFLKNESICDVVISVFSLQFMGKIERRLVIKELKRLIDNGAIVLLAEKIFLDNKIDRVMRVLHSEEKRKHFCDTEILNKELDLLGHMQCLSAAQFKKELNMLGNYSQIWQSYNFVGYAVWGEAL